MDKPPPTMPPALLVVSATIDPAAERDWNRWYDQIHLPEILACPHFEAGARYVSEAEDGRRYVTVYALSSAEALKTPQFARARGWAEFRGKVDATTRFYTRVGEAGHE